MQSLHPFSQSLVGNLLTVASTQMALANAAIATVVLVDTMVSLEQVATRITALSLNASGKPEKTHSFRSEGKPPADFLPHPSGSDSSGSAPDQAVCSVDASAGGSERMVS